MARGLIRPAKPGHRVHHLSIPTQFQIKRAAPIRPGGKPAKRLTRQQRCARFGIQSLKPGQDQMQAGAAFQNDDLPKAPEGAGEYRAPGAGADDARTAHCRERDPSRRPGFAPLAKGDTDPPMHRGGRVWSAIGGAG